MEPYLYYCIVIYKYIYYDMSKHLNICSICGYYKQQLTIHIIYYCVMTNNVRSSFCEGSKL